MNKEQYTQILLPGGEWLPSILQAFAAANLELETENPRCYRYTLVNQALPLKFDVVRSWAVNSIADDPDTLAWAGFTGTDILLEQGLRASFLLTLLENAPQAALFLGTTPNYPGDVENQLSLANSTIYTTYPNITTWYLKKTGQLRVKVKYSAGKIEGLWRVDPENWAVLDISATGETAEKNKIKKRKKIMTPSVGGYISPRAPARDRERVNDLEELLYLAIRGGN